MSTYDQKERRSHETFTYPSSRTQSTRPTEHSYTQERYSYSLNGSLEQPRRAAVDSGNHQDASESAAIRVPYPTPRSNPQRLPFFKYGKTEPIFFRERETQILPDYPPGLKYGTVSVNFLSQR